MHRKHCDIRYTREIITVARRMQPEKTSTERYVKAEREGVSELHI